MFAPGIKRKIEGFEVDRPFNAMALTPDLHGSFGGLHIYFDEVQGALPHTYSIKSFRPTPGLPVVHTPIVRTLLSSPSHPVDMPDRQLLAVHRACAMILHLSGAGDYIDHLFHDFSDGPVRTDGLTDLGSIVSLRLTLHDTCSRA
jgi:hypothetical protein